MALITLKAKIQEISIKQQNEGREPYHQILLLTPELTDSDGVVYRKSEIFQVLIYGSNMIKKFFGNKHPDELYGVLAEFKLYLNSIQRSTNEGKLYYNLSLGYQDHKII